MAMRARVRHSASAPIIEASSAPGATMTSPLSPASAAACPILLLATSSVVPASRLATPFAQHGHEIVQGFDARQSDDVDAFVVPARLELCALPLIDYRAHATIDLACFDRQAAGDEGLLQQLATARAMHDQHACAARERELRMRQQCFAVEAMLRNDVGGHLH